MATAAYIDFSQSGYSQSAWANHWGAVYAAGAPGLLHGGVNQFMIQVVGALAAIIWAFVAGLIVFKLIGGVI